MPTFRRERSALRAPAAALCLLAVAGCATLRPAARDARRAEEASERVPPPATSATPRPARRTAVSPPPPPGAVAPSHIAVVALGSRYPAADNLTAAGRVRNRRVVVLALR